MKTSLILELRTNARPVRAADLRAELVSNTLYQSNGDTFRVDSVTELLVAQDAGLAYIVEARGPILTSTGKEHAVYRGQRVYADAQVTELPERTAPLEELPSIWQVEDASLLYGRHALLGALGQRLSDVGALTR